MKRILIYLSIGLLLPLLTAVSLFFANAYLPHRLPSTLSSVYEFPKGNGLIQLAYDLHRHGFIAHPRLFILLAKLQGDTKRLQAGEYDFGRKASPLQILRKMRKGEVVVHWITFVEGWTSAQMLNATHQNKDLQTTIIDVNQMHDFVPDRLSAEGVFFPSTYQFVKGTPDTAIFKLAHVKMITLLNYEWRLKDPLVPYASPYEALIAASLIEKETAIDNERYLIASVLVNRLKQHIPLQFDPSVLYATGRTKGAITKEDLQVKSLYNTYVSQGLPPTPIANPGQSAIHAALHPQSTNYIYFVANGHGEHYFSETLQEHLLAVKRFRAQGKQQ